MHSMSFTLSLNNPSRTFKHGHIIMGGLSGEERSGVKDKGAEEEGEEEKLFLGNLNPFEL